VLVQMYNNMPKLIPFYKDYAAGDELVLTYLELYDEVTKHGFNRNKPTVYINRHDFMCDKDENEFMEIEFNLMCPTGGFDGYNIQRVLNHYYTLVQRKEVSLLRSEFKKFQKSTFVELWSHYHNPDAYAVLLIHKDECNLFEIAQHQALMMKAGIKTIKINVQDLHKDKLSLDDKNNLIFYGLEIGLIYYRHLYDASHFIADSKHFVVLAERSNAICLPSVESWLINGKMNQYLMYSRDVQQKYGISIDLGSFAPHLCPHYMLRDNFNNDKQKMLEFIGKDVGGYLLKTFREGGFGDIIGDQAMLDFIRDQPEDVLNRYLLAKRIRPACYPSLVLMAGQTKFFEESVSELGIFTAAVLNFGSDDKWSVGWQSEGDGHLLRSKTKTALKGGVAVRVGFIDTLAHK